MLLPGLLALFACFPQEPGPPPAPSPAARPDLLLVVIDDASWEEFERLPLSTYRSLRDKARIYTRFYVSPLCSPSRAQLHFGRYPHRDGLGKALDPRRDQGVPLERECIAESLKAAGYATGLFGKWHVSGTLPGVSAVEVPQKQGFDVWRAGNLANLTDHYRWMRFDDGARSECQTYSTLAVLEASTAWWAAAPAPRFASVCFFAPHEPFQRAPEELTRELRFPSNLRGNFDSALVGVDTAIGRLLAQVDLSKTFVFILPDNGSPGDMRPPDARSPGYKAKPYEGGIRVPLIVAGPGVVPGEDHSLVQAADVPRTLLELAGVPPQTGFEDSLSFEDSLRGAGPGPRPFAFLQRYDPNGFPERLSHHDWAVVRADGKKLLQCQEARETRLELYDLVLDPWEGLPLGSTDLIRELTALKDQALGPEWRY
jgi:arylsulfatase A